MHLVCLSVCLFVFFLCLRILFVYTYIVFVCHYTKKNYRSSLEMKQICFFQDFHGFERDQVFR